MIKKALIGNGGFATDVMSLLGDFNIMRFVDDVYYNPEEKNTAPLSKFDPSEYAVLVAVADPAARESIVARMPKETRYMTVIDPSTRIMVNGPLKIGSGSIICANCIIIDGTEIGAHCHLNLATILGHDVKIGNFFTSAPGVKIMGNNTIGDRVHFGANSVTRQKINICDDVIIGLNAGVIKDIVFPGVYVGTPAKRIRGMNV